MKTSTVLVIALAGVAIVYVVTRPKTSTLPLSTGTTSTNSLLGQLGALAGGLIVGAGGTVSRPTATAAGSNGGGGLSESELKSLDSTNIDAYDAQGTTTTPVYGIAGLDY